MGRTPPHTPPVIVHPIVVGQPVLSDLFRRFKRTPRSIIREITAADLHAPLKQEHLKAITFILDIRLTRWRRPLFFAEIHDFPLKRYFLRLMNIRDVIHPDPPAIREIEYVIDYPALGRVLNHEVFKVQPEERESLV